VRLHRRQRAQRTHAARATTRRDTILRAARCCASPCGSVQRIVNPMRTVALALALATTGIASAVDGSGADAVLAGVAQHPGLRAAEAAVEAARLRAGAVRSPLTVSLDASLQRLQVDPPSDPLPPPFDDLFDIDERSERATVTAVLRPLVAGDLRDLLDQRQLDLERAELSLRETRAALETQALRAAAGVLLAERGVALARDGEALAERGLEATRTRHASGAASDIELRRAELQLADATRGVARAERQLASAEAGLRQLAGDARLHDLPALEPVLWAPPDLIRAALDVALAEVGVRNQARGLLPTVQAGYTWLFDEGDSLTLGLESRTLQPSLSYASGGAGAPGAGATGIGINDGGALEGVVPEVRGSLTVSLSWTLSPQLALEAEASRRQLDAAAAGLEAAHDRAALQRQAERDALSAAREALALADLERALTIDEVAAASQRYEAGLIGVLERDQALLTLASTELAWWTARVDLLGAVLDTYVTYAIPPSEVRP